VGRTKVFGLIILLQQITPFVRYTERTTIQTASTVVVTPSHFRHMAHTAPVLIVSIHYHTKVDSHMSHTERSLALPPDHTAPYLLPWRKKNSILSDLLTGSSMLDKVDVVQARLVINCHCEQRASYTTINSMPSCGRIFSASDSTVYS
jgi:hypothetical protein